LNSIAKKILYLYSIIYTIIAVLYFYNVVTELFLISSLYAGILNFINTFAAVKFFNKSYKSGTSTFMIYTLGGLGLRLMVLLIVFVLVIKFLDIDKYGFILVFFIFYFISLIIEVLFYLKKTKKIV